MNTWFNKVGKAVARRMPRRLGVALAGALLVLGIGTATAITAAPANASATHCAWVGPIHVAGYTLPTGQYCFSVNGSGLYVNGTISSYNSGWVYNLSEHIDLFDNYGNDYYSYWDYNAPGTLYGYHIWTSNLTGYARPGSICGTLYSSGVVIARVCNGIHP